jgi:hypothetical protein
MYKRKRLAKSQFLLFWDISAKLCASMAPKTRRGMPFYLSSLLSQHLNYKTEAAYLLIKKTTTATMTRYMNSGLVYIFIFASTKHNDLSEIQLFHLSLILSQF